MLDWSQFTVLITGASDGIGRELALEIDSRGVEQLILIGRDVDRLNAVAASCRSKTRIEVVDLTCSDQVQDLFQRLESVQVDVLINNAGVGVGGVFHQDPDPVRLSAMIDLNCKSVIALTRQWLPGMITRRRGHLLFVGSLAGVAGGPGLCVYSATKGFVNRFAEGLRWELHGSGVQVSLLAPGITSTSFFQSAGIPDELVRSGSMSASSVAKIAVRGMEKNRARIVPGIRNKVLLMLQGWVPRSIVGAISRRIFRPLMRSNH